MRRPVHSRTPVYIEKNWKKNKIKITVSRFRHGLYGVCAAGRPLHSQTPGCHEVGGQLENCLSQSQSLDTPVSSQTHLRQVQGSTETHHENSGMITNLNLFLNGWRPTLNHKWFAAPLKSGYILPEAVPIAFETILMARVISTPCAHSCAAPA